VENTVWSVVVSIIDKNQLHQNISLIRLLSQAKRKRESERRGIGQAKIIMGWPIQALQLSPSGPPTLE